MKFFIDTANIDEIRSALEMGLVDGVTTNPSLAAKEGREFEPLIKEICQLVGDRPVSAEVISLDAEGMIREAEVVAKWAPNIVVKIPMTTEGIKAVNHLTAQGIKTNVTLVFSPLQALLAAKAGATYISPFVGRLDDIGQNGMELIEQVVAILDNYGLASEVIVASVRHPIHVLDSAMIGAHIATIPYKVIKQLAAHPLTDKGIAAFLSDWEKLQEDLKK